MLPSVFLKYVTVQYKTAINTMPLLKKNDTQDALKREANMDQFGVFTRMAS
ncbi:hypothetical protein GCM10008066_03510 [Oxalicibacterium faecigallinarum]|uniref:Uncharacterized protein n=1 Tax=Oxalicibacterium faecigallinarum TaxID=573741 RepID=A0A8J3AKZ4_9BURK|nr:hypothetical protein GCM10008066_03510 [Oxalicibacterium faecigallinarum]